MNINTYVEIRRGDAALALGRQLASCALIIVYGECRVQSSAQIYALLKKFSLLSRDLEVDTPLPQRRSAYTYK